MKTAENYNSKEIDAVLNFCDLKTNDKREERNRVIGVAYNGPFMEIALFYGDGEVSIVKLTPSYDNSASYMFDHFKNNVHEHRD